MMKRGAVSVGLLAATLCGCATTGRSIATADITPEQAVMQAAAAPYGIAGTFRFKVLASGHQREMFYLDSQYDYRDQRNIAIDVTPVLYDQLTKRFGEIPDKALQGKTLVVKGVAQRVKIFFIGDNGVPSDKYYYQTHVPLRQEQDLQVVN